MRTTSLALAFLVIGCADATKASEDGAAANVLRVAAQADKDVAEVRQGIGDGAAKIQANLFDKEKEIVPTVARAALKKSREQVTVLQLAKSTFFAVTDPNGIALGSDQDVDVIAGKNLLAALPELAKAKTAPEAEAIGDFAEAKGVKSGDDLVWAAAAPVRGKDGALTGLYVTGWSFRRFAYHLEEQLKSDLRQQAAKAGQGTSKMPLVYVFVLKGTKAYGAPVTPDVNAHALESFGIGAKLVGDAVVKAHVDITNRTFGIAAKRVPSLCADCAVAVLQSEV